MVICRIFICHIQMKNWNDLHVNWIYWTVEIILLR